MSAIDADDEDFAAIRPGTLDKFAGGWVALLGVFTAVLGAQTMVIAGWLLITLVGLVQLATGLVTLALGVLITRRRGTGAMGGAIASLVVFLTVSAWVVFLAYSSAVSLLAFALPVFALPAIGLAAATIPGALQADKARYRLREAGLSTGA